MDATPNTNGASLLPLITEAERTVREAITHFGLKVKPEQISITIASKGRKNALGWFWGNSWHQTKTASWHEINLSAEHLDTCDVGELIIHELAHAENHTLGIRDCANRIHNKKFKVMAERLGLEVLPRCKSVGFGYTKRAAGAEAFLSKIAFRRDIFAKHRAGAAAKPKSGGTRMLKCECPACGYLVRITQKWLDVGTPVCPCGEEMSAS